MTRPRAPVVAFLALVASAELVACPKATAPTIAADPAGDAAPSDVAKAPSPADANLRLAEVLECAPHVAGDDCFGNAEFPLHCTYVGKNEADEARLWDAVWHDGKHHARFDALDAFGASKSPRLADARCLRAGADDDYNMFAWCCRAP